MSSSELILKRLKDETRDEHVSIEHSLDLLSEKRSLEDYRNLLARFYGFYAPFESKLQTSGWLEALSFDYSERSKSERLQADLLDLGFTPESLIHLPQCSELPPLDSSAQALGCLYVMEGSTLGGNVLSRQFKERFHLENGRGLAYFSSYGTRLGEFWRETQLLLQREAGRVGADRVDADEMIASARTMFRSLEAWMMGAR